MTSMLLENFGSRYWSATILLHISHFEFIYALKLGGESLIRGSIAVPNAKNCTYLDESCAVKGDIL